MGANGDSRRLPPERRVRLGRGVSALRTADSSGNQYSPFLARGDSSEAGEHGYACGLTEDALLLVSAYDIDAIPPGDAEAYLEGAQLQLAALRRDVRWVDARSSVYHSIARVARDERQPMPSTAPCSIFPFDTHVCVRLLLGRIAYRVELNLDLLEYALAQRGWAATEPPNLPHPRGFAYVSRDTTTVAIPTSLADQIFVELLTVDALADSLDTAHDAMTRHQERAAHHGFAWSSEEITWR
jgi:hypothetical protein